MEGNAALELLPIEQVMYFYVASACIYWRSVISCPVTILNVYLKMHRNAIFVKAENHSSYSKQYHSIQTHILNSEVGCCCNMYSFHLYWVGYEWMGQLSILSGRQFLFNCLCIKSTWLCMSRPTISAVIEGGFLSKSNP